MTEYERGVSERFITEIAFSGGRGAQPWTLRLSSQWRRIEAARCAASRLWCRPRGGGCRAIFPGQFMVALRDSAEPESRTLPRLRRKSLSAGKVRRRPLSFTWARHALVRDPTGVAAAPCPSEPCRPRQRPDRARPLRVAGLQVQLCRLLSLATALERSSRPQRPEQKRAKRPVARRDGRIGSSRIRRSRQRRGDRARVRVLRPERPA